MNNIINVISVIFILINLGIKKIDLKNKLTDKNIQIINIILGIINFLLIVANVIIFNKSKNYAYGLISLIFFYLIYFINIKYLKKKN